jgi:hypothetical protein
VLAADPTSTVAKGALSMSYEHDADSVVFSSLSRVQIPLFPKPKFGCFSDSEFDP